MAVTFDPDKNARNIAERGLSFERAADLDWETAVIIVGTRRDCGERTANRREVRLYGKKDDG
jgi:uncharacterized DUF497 family protein